MTQSEIEAIYGEPGDPKNQTRIIAPFPLYLSWDPKVKVRTITCHKLVAEDLLSILHDLLDCYSIDNIKRLGIDLYGGCLNVRKMRGGSKWSMHAWGIAIDLHPAKNRLQWKSDKALFAIKDYKDMIDIFEKHGWYSLGREKNYDWMHFQKIKP